MLSYECFKTGSTTDYTIDTNLNYPIREHMFSCIKRLGALGIIKLGNVRRTISFSA